MPNIYEWPSPANPDRTQKILSEHPEFSNPNVAVTASTLTLRAELHAGRTMLFDLVTGNIITLPAAIGSGNRYKFMVKTLATSNSHIVKVANATDVMAG